MPIVRIGEVETLGKTQDWLSPPAPFPQAHSFCFYTCGLSPSTFT